ncbi:MAG TPA: NAD-dependent epimerase/dehydratase family protein [Gemmatimonadales bacterium]|nr:NAD-dependent epimerase/dehydratase family protein [Gemmatimonadales bacterium]
MGRRVLVTGGAGFIGSHVAEAYLGEGWEVTVLDDLSRGKREQVPAGARLIQTDVRSPEARRAAGEGGFDVLNLQAAQIDVRVSVERPDEDCDVNLRGLVNLLMGARDGGIPRVVFASSGGVIYGEAAQVPTPESAPKQPVSPYGVSKLAGEHYLHALGTLYGFEAVALRYANVFGPRQDPRSEAGVVSIFVSRLLAGDPLTIFGDGRQTRDYVFVRDVARANLLAGTATLEDGDGIDASGINIATGGERSVLDLAAAVGGVLGREPRLAFAAPRAGELQRSSLDPAKAGRVLGWRPAYRFEEGLEALIAWFREAA